MAHISFTGNRWEITGDIEINNATALLAASQKLEMVSNTQIDFSKVAEIDTAAISLIFEWKRRAIAENKQLSFLNLPANLKSLTQLYGVAELIN